MGWGFRKSVNLGCGLRLNLSKSGIGFSAGIPGFRVGTGPSGGRMRLTIPGTGLYYEERTGGKKNRQSSKLPPSPPPPPIPEQQPVQRIKINWWDSLTIPHYEKLLVKGINCLLEGNKDEAYSYLKDCLAEEPACADAAWAAALAINNKDEQLGLIRAALTNQAGFETVFKKYNIVITVNLDITDELSLRICNDKLGLILFAAEIYQAHGFYTEAEEVLKNNSDLPIVKLSLVELYLQAGNYPQCVALAQHIKEQDMIGILAQLYLGEGLIGMGFYDSSAMILEKLLTATNAYDTKVEWETRYVLAEAYLKMGRQADARRQWEFIYAESHDYKDVGELLGIR